MSPLLLGATNLAIGTLAVALLLYFVLRPKDVLVKEDAE